MWHVLWGKRELNSPLSNPEYENILRISADTDSSPFIIILFIISLAIFIFWLVPDSDLIHLRCKIMNRSLSSHGATFSFCGLHDSADSHPPVFLFNKSLRPRNDVQCF